MGARAAGSSGKRSIDCIQPNSFHRLLIRMIRLLTTAVLWLGIAACVHGANYFGVCVVDQDTGRGVPMVELRTVNDVSHWTDSGGWIAIDCAGLGLSEKDDHPIYFHVRSHGYEVPADGFGYRGVRLNVRAGETETLQIKRTNLAERIYRVTGEGIYRDSVLLGQPVPITEPLVNAGVVGSDSVLTAVYQNRLHWFWGDTNFANYPLGNFHVPGATSVLPSDGGFPPEIGVDLSYFTDASGHAKPTCRLPGDGPTWIFGLTVVDEPNARDDAMSRSMSRSMSQSMFAGYAKIKPPLQAYERGIVRWNDASNEFEKVATFPLQQQGYPMGHPIVHEGFVHYCDPLPWVRVPASAKSIVDPNAYEVYSCFTTNERDSEPKLDRDADGELIWKWRPGMIRMTRELEAQLVRTGELHENERKLQMRTADSDRRWTLHTASIAWNDFRKRWIMIGLEVGGESSMLGEVYYCEAEDLLGPWSPAKKIVSHERYSFYNPRLHPMLSSDEGRHVYFEGTYTRSFSDAKDATPRYDYNQIMYRLHLQDVTNHVGD